LHLNFDNSIRVREKKIPEKSSLKFDSEKRPGSPGSAIGKNTGSGSALM
jgi:hypothetical protein